MKIVVAVLFLLLLPLSFSISCENIPGKYSQECNEIMVSNAGLAEKQYLVANLMNDNNLVPAHELVNNWDNGITFSDAPEGVFSQDSGYIRNGWLKIIAIEPSVIYEDKLLSPGTGKLLSAYNYQIELPEETESGDCETHYSLESQDEQLDVYLNNELIGHSKLTDIHGTGTFKDILTITSVTEVRHYEDHEYCCGYDETGCSDYCTECKFHDSETRTHHLTLEDTKNTVLDWGNVNPVIEGIEEHFGTSQGKLTINDFTSFKLSFEDSSYQENRFYYDFVLSLAPYDVLTIRAKNYTRKNSDNMVVDNLGDEYRFFVTNPDACNLEFTDHFHKWEQSCSLTFNQPEINISTDKQVYSADEPIIVSLLPQNTEMQVTYGDESKTVQNEAQFTAKENINKVSAVLGDREAQQVVHVKSKVAWQFVVDLSVFSGLMYFIYELLKRYWGAVV